jgi:hypothetical protein
MEFVTTNKGQQKNRVGRPIKENKNNKKVVLS